MTKLERIERDIAALSSEELVRLREWFERHEAAAFDRRIERDVTGGHLDTLADAALADHRAGKTHPL